MPFAILPLGNNDAGDPVFAIQHLGKRHRGKIATPRFKSLESAVNTAKRWMEFRHEDPYVVRRRVADGSYITHVLAR